MYSVSENKMVVKKQADSFKSDISISKFYNTLLLYQHMSLVVKMNFKQFRINTLKDEYHRSCQCLNLTDVIVFGVCSLVLLLSSIVFFVGVLILRR